MSDLIPVQVPFTNPNDTAATLVEWLVEQHATVTVGQLLVRLETTKTVIDLDSPATGRLERVAEAGADLLVGAVIGFVGVPVEAPQAAAQPPVLPHERTAVAGEETLLSEDLSDPGSVGRSALPADSANVRLSQRAQLMAQRMGVDPATLGLVGLVRVREFVEAVERYPI